MLPDGRNRVRHNRRAHLTPPHPVFRTWRRKRVIKRATIDEALWNRVVAQLPFLAGLSADDARKQANWGPYKEWYLSDSQDIIAIRKVYEELDGKLK